MCPDLIDRDACSHHAILAEARRVGAGGRDLCFPRPVKIVVTRPVAEDALALLRPRGDVRVGPAEPPIPTADEVARMIADADVVYTLPANPLTGDAIRGATKLRMRQALPALPVGEPHNFHATLFWR